MLICVFALLHLTTHAIADRIFGYAYFDNRKECGDGEWQECVLSVSAKIDVDCDGVPDSIEIRKMISRSNVYGAMRIFDQHGVYKNEMIFLTTTGGNHLGMIQLPFDPVNDSGYVCSQRILDFFFDGRGMRIGNLPVKQNGLRQIKYIMKNSIERAPSEWMDMVDIDTAFQAYCSVISPSDFAELGIDQSEWIKSYFGCDYFGAEYCDSLLVRNTPGLLLCYFAHNQLIRRHTRTEEGRLIPVQEIREIPISNDIMLYQTAHGVLLRKGHLGRWIYLRNYWPNVHWPTPSIYKVTVSGGQINIFLEEDYDYENPEESKSLPFSLKDLLR